MSLVSRGLNRKYLKLQNLRRLEHLRFAGRRRVEGLYSGRHATPQRGQSVEFRDYREYHPGDEMGRIDWRVYGRTDRLYVRLFEHQSELTLQLLVDASASMAYRGLPDKKTLSKYDYACHLAASLGYLTVRQHDRVGGGFARKGLQNYHRPSGALPEFLALLQTMERVRPGQAAGLAEALQDLASRATRRDVLVVFSDFLDESEQILKALAQLRHRGGEAIVFQVLHPDELRLPDLDSGVFIDSESNARLSLQVDDVRAAYDARLAEFLETWKRTCRGHEIPYTLASTAEPYFTVLERFLRQRQGTSRVGV